MQYSGIQNKIKFLKCYFEKRLSDSLSLFRVSAPLFLEADSGLNDNLNGIEVPVSFEVNSVKLEIVHSLAKWKRYALKEYGFKVGEGLYTDMNAIRKDERLDNLHSLYVDQWDYEKIINKEDRTYETLKEYVKKIYQCLKDTGDYIRKEYPSLKHNLPDDIYFITTQELEDMYPSLSPKEREDKICRKYKAVFLSQIGDTLKSGKEHDDRAPDYDDWELNGDILLYYDVLNCAFEISSMGIRVDKDRLLYQLKKSGCMDRINLPYHQAIINEELPYTIGGGIGQSRMCMFFLKKKHIGEVQSSYWQKEERERCKKEGIFLL